MCVYFDVCLYLYICVYVCVCERECVCLGMRPGGGGESGSGGVILQIVTDSSILLSCILSTRVDRHALLICFYMYIAWMYVYRHALLIY